MSRKRRRIDGGGGGVDDDDDDDIEEVDMNIQPVGEGGGGGALDPNQIYDQDVIRLRQQGQVKNQWKELAELIQLPPIIECEAKCKSVNGDHIDYQVHIEEGLCYPCPLIFHEPGVILMDGKFEIVDPETMTRQCIIFGDQQDVKDFYNHFQLNVIESIRDREIYRHCCILLGIRKLLIDASNMFKGQIDRREHIGSLESVEQYFDMIEYFNKPFKSLDDQSVMQGGDLLVKQLIISFNNYFRFPSSYWHADLELVNDIWNRIIEGNKVCKFDPASFDELRQRYSCIVNGMRTTFVAFVHQLNPPTISMELSDPTHERYQALDLVSSLIIAHRGVITDVSIENEIKLAFPIRSKITKEDTYTFTEDFSISQALSYLHADKSSRMLYAMHGRFINLTLASSHETSQVPLMPQDVFRGQRFISFHNGLFCCQSAIFYYFPRCLDPRIPPSYRFTTSYLETNSKCRIRALKHIPIKLEYYNIMTFLFKTAWARDQNPSFAAQKRNIETEATSTNLFDIDEKEVFPPKNTQKYQEMMDWVDNIWKHFHTHMFNADFLAKLDPIDYKVYTLQKIFADQRLPMNVYRHIYEVFGRCLAGIMCDHTRDKSFSQQFMEKITGAEIRDNLQYATSIEGVAGTGKSSILEILGYYVDSNWIGNMADTERPIESHGTMAKGVFVQASDLVEGRLPISAAELKKAISLEEIVLHRLRQSSLKFVYVAHFLLAMNIPLPWPDNLGDMTRRFTQIKFAHRLSKRDMTIIPGDRRGLFDIFKEYDRGVIPVLSAVAHLRRLINVGGNTFYNAQHPLFQPPQYLIHTKDSYESRQNSLRAFVNIQERKGLYSSSVEYRDWSVHLSDIVADYKKFCEEEQYKELPTDKIHSMMVHDFGLTMKGQGDGIKLYGVRYKDKSLKPDETKDDDPNWSQNQADDDVVDDDDQQGLARSMQQAKVQEQLTVEVQPAAEQPAAQQQQQQQSSGGFVADDEMGLEFQ